MHRPVDLTCLISGPAHTAAARRCLSSCTANADISVQVIWLYDSSQALRPQFPPDIALAPHVIDVVGQTDLAAIIERHVRGGIVAVLDSASLLLPDAFARARELLYAETRLAGVHFAPAVVDEHGHLGASRELSDESTAIPHSWMVKRTALVRHASRISAQITLGADIFQVFAHYGEPVTYLAEYGIALAADIHGRNLGPARRLPRADYGAAQLTPHFTYIIFANERLWPISKTIAALQAQTVANWEAIVFYPPHVELKRFATALDDAGRVRCIALTQNSARGAEMALGANLAKGEILSFLRAGNTVPPTHLQAVADAFAMDCEAAVALSPTRLIMIDNDRTGWVSYDAFACVAQDPVSAIAPRAPVDALSIFPKRLANFQGFSARGYLFAHWELLAGRGGADVLVNSLVDYTVRLKDIDEDCELRTILADFDLWQLRSSGHSAFTAIAERCRVEIIGAHAALLANPRAVPVREAFYRAVYGASLTLADVVNELSFAEQV